MKTLLIGFAALPFLTGIAVASQPALLSDVQMDKVTGGDFTIPAGFYSFTIPPTTVTVTVDNPNSPPPTVTYVVSSPGFSYSSPAFVISTPKITVSH
jgi:hypothetical protein